MSENAPPTLIEQKRRSWSTSDLRKTQGADAEHARYDMRKQKSQTSDGNSLSINNKQFVIARGHWILQPKDSFTPHDHAYHSAKRIQNLVGIRSDQKIYKNQKNLNCTNYQQ